LQVGVLLAAVVTIGAVALSRPAPRRPVHYRRPLSPAAQTPARWTASCARPRTSKAWESSSSDCCLLIATPVARVALAIAGFALERDRLYTVVSVIVLLILLASLMHAT
jgi:hypothetical protein